MLNEAAVLPGLLATLKPFTASEIIFVDGGSTDESINLVQAAGFTVITSEPGRALQMNAGAQLATGDTLLFLHADTQVPEITQERIIAVMADPTHFWGRFDVNIVGDGRLLPLIANLMNFRSRRTGIATGDQAMFVRRELFQKVGGFAAIPIMEDIDLSKRLKKHAPPVCLRLRVNTSGRRWQKRGVIPTVLLMWWLRLAYWLGVSPKRLAAWYR